MTGETHDMHETPEDLRRLQTLLDESVAAEAEAGVDTLAFLAGECEATDCDPRQAAHYAILDLGAALVASAACATPEN